MNIKFKPLFLLLTSVLFSSLAIAKTDIHSGALPDTIDIEKRKSWIYKLPKKRASLEFTIKLKQNDYFQIIFSNNSKFSSEILRLSISDADCDAEHQLFATYTLPKNKKANLFKYMDHRVPWNQEQKITINWIDGNRFTITRNNESFSLDIFALPRFIKFYSYESEVTLNTSKITFAD